MAKPTFFASPDELRRWLDKHHATASELLVGFHKMHTGKPSVTWSQAVDEALCYGWIDGIRRSLGEAAYMIRFTPRKPTSIWSAINVAKVAELTKLGKMQPAGLRAFAHRTPERTGVYSFERREAAQLTPAQDRELRANSKAAAFFDAQPPGYQRTAIHWVISAKQEATRARRLAQLIMHSAAGRRIPPLVSPGKASPTRRAAPSRRARARTAGPRRSRRHPRPRAAPRGG